MRSCEAPPLPNPPLHFAEGREQNAFYIPLIAARLFSLPSTHLWRGGPGRGGSRSVHGQGYPKPVLPPTFTVTLPNSLARCVLVCVFASEIFAPVFEHHERNRAKVRFDPSFHRLSLDDWGVKRAIAWFDPSYGMKKHAVMRDPFPSGSFAKSKASSVVILLQPSAQSRRLGSKTSNSMV